MTNYTSSKYDPAKGELIPTVIVEMYSLQDYWLTKSHYDAEGKFKGVLQSLCISIAEVKKVHHVLKYASEYPTEAWEG